MSQDQWSAADRYITGLFIPPDPYIQGVRRINATLAGQPRLSATVIQTVGSKGYDSLAFAVVTGEPE